MSRRVVVTGLGSLTPYGYGTDLAWNGVLSGQSCITKVNSVDLDDSSVSVGGEIKWKKSGGWFDPADFVSKKDAARLSRFIAYGLAAATDAMVDANLDKCSNVDASRYGVILGTGAGGMDALESGICDVYQRGSKKLTPFFVPSLLCNLVVGNISMKYNLQGPGYAVVSACASGNHAIGEAARTIKCGDADVILAGGAESAYCRSGFAGFAALRALSTKSENPELASRPYDQARDGFIMSEGSAILILEEYEHAKARGAKIYAEVSGYGLSSDAYHITAPHPEGVGAKNSMLMALRSAKLNSSDIGYISAHGTSTPLGDQLEIMALKSVFEDYLPNIPISSTKSCTGHMLGAAAALEAIFSINVINKGLIPPTINLDNPDPVADGLNLVPNKSISKEVDHVMSNALGFGGCNATVIFSKV